MRTAQGIAADVAAAVSGTGAVASWLVYANSLLQLGATAIAIVAGVYAIKWHRLRIRDMRAKLEKESVKHEDKSQ